MAAATGVGGHDVAFAIAIAAGIQAIADKGRQRLEVAVVLLGNKVIREYQRVVLIGDDLCSLRAIEPLTMKQ